MRIIPLGGLDQIGMNITAFEYDTDIIVVDCGLAFPEDDMLGIDLVIPDTSYLEDNIDRVRGMVITHGHEDHIGAIPYVLQKLPVPLYGTRLTMALIEGKLSEHGMTDTVQRNVVSFGDVVRFGQMSVEFIKTNHSITDACALAITSPVGTIVHTGDFKVDYTPVFGDPIDLARFAELGKKGVLALMCDSTNAERPGFTNSERTVGRAFDTIFADHQKSRIIVATFSSNVDRVQQIFDAAQRYGRKVVLEGRSMVNIIKTAIDIGYVSIPEGILIDISQIKNYPDEKTVIITTGSQGESMAALSRIASNMHKTVSIKQGDVVVFSSNPIPGNEKAVFKVINELSLKGAEVIFQDTHVSGHACQEEIKLIYTLTRPKFAIPVHGEHRHLMAQRNIAVDVGIPKENVKILSNGQILEIDEDGANVVGDVANGAVFVDGLGVGDVGNVVLRDRQRLADDGIVIVCMTLEPGTNIVIAGPVVMSRGFVYIKESDEFMLEATEVVRLALEKIQDKNITSRNRIRDNIKDALSSFIWKRIKRSPMILPIIMENETGFGD
ncbi:MAG: ribonuclease J [Lachnospiraceae bacterium]|nr:ribonuclease J [Lachnospiraceae bacterium]